MKGYPLTISSSLNSRKGCELNCEKRQPVDATGVTISGGSCYCPVTVEMLRGVITGGSFYGPVTVKNQRRDSQARAPAARSTTN